MDRKIFRPLSACTSRTSKEKDVVEEEVLPPSDDKTEDDDWEHTMFSDSNDDDGRDLSYFKRQFQDFLMRDDISDDEDFQHKFVGEVVRRFFSIPVEKHSKLLNQKEKTWRLNLLLSKRPDIMHDSCGEEVFKKLDNEGLINNIPKNVAMTYINRAIWRKEHFYHHDLRYEIIKKLVTAVPCIRIGTRYCTSQVANFVRMMGLANIRSNMLVVPLAYMRRKLAQIMQVDIHPVVYMDRINETLSVVENDAKRSYRELIQSWKNRPMPYFINHIKREEAEIISSEDYQIALNVVQLHQEFHKHIGSCLFIQHDMKIKDLMKDKMVVESRFVGLDKTLIKASLKERIKLLRKLNELDVYYAWLVNLIDCKIKKGQSRMDSILQVIKADHPDFPKLPDKWFFRKVSDIPCGWTDEEKQEELTLFYGLVDRVKEHTRCPLPYAFVIEGIVEYMDACVMIEHVRKPSDFKDPSFYIKSHFLSARNSWLQNMAWDDIVYDHRAYTTIYEDVSLLV